MWLASTCSIWISDLWETTASFIYIYTQIISYINGEQSFVLHEPNINTLYTWPGGSYNGNNKINLICITSKSFKSESICFFNKINDMTMNILVLSFKVIIARIPWNCFFTTVSISEHFQIHINIFLTSHSRKSHGPYITISYVKHTDNHRV